MNKLGREIRIDLDFLKSHTLQPKWYKIFKIFILVGFLAGYYFLFGLIRSIIFFSCFIFFSLIIHYTYRIKTKKYTQSWLDFVVEGDQGVRPNKFGKFYYPALVISVILSWVISQVVSP